MMKQKEKVKNIQFLAFISVCVSSDQREWELYLGWNLNFTLLLSLLSMLGWNSATIPDWIIAKDEG